MVHEGDLLARDFLKLQWQRHHLEALQWQSQGLSRCRQAAEKNWRSASVGRLDRQLKRNAAQQQRMQERNQELRQQATLHQRQVGAQAALPAGSLGYTSSDSIERLRNSRETFAGHVERMAGEWHQMLEEQTREEIKLARNDAAHCQFRQQELLLAAQRQEQLFQELSAEHQRVKEERSKLYELDHSLATRSRALREQLQQDRGPAYGGASGSAAVVQALPGAKAEAQHYGAALGSDQAAPLSPARARPYMPEAGSRHFEVHQRLLGYELEMDSDLRCLETMLRPRPVRESISLGGALEPPAASAGDAASLATLFAPLAPAPVVHLPPAPPAAAGSLASDVGLRSPTPARGSGGLQQHLGSGGGTVESLAYGHASQASPRQWPTAESTDGTAARLAAMGAAAGVAGVLPGEATLPAPLLQPPFTAPPTMAQDALRAGAGLPFGAQRRGPSPRGPAPGSPSRPSVTNLQSLAMEVEALRACRPAAELARELEALRASLGGPSPRGTLPRTGDGDATTVTYSAATAPLRPVAATPTGGLLGLDPGGGDAFRFVEAGGLTLAPHSPVASAPPDARSAVPVAATLPAAGTSPGLESSVPKPQGAGGDDADAAGGGLTVCSSSGSGLAAAQQAPHPWPAPPQPLAAEPREPREPASSGPVPAEGGQRSPRRLPTPTAGTSGGPSPEGAAGSGALPAKTGGPPPPVGLAAAATASTMSPPPLPPVLQQQGQAQPLQQPPQPLPPLPWMHREEQAPPVSTAVVPREAGESSAAEGFVGNLGGPSALALVAEDSVHAQVPPIMACSPASHSGEMGFSLGHSHELASSGEPNVDNWIPTTARSVRADDSGGFDASGSLEALLPLAARPAAAAELRSAAAVDARAGIAASPVPAAQLAPAMPEVSPAPVPAEEPEVAAMEALGAESPFLDDLKRCSTFGDSLSVSGESPRPGSAVATGSQAPGGMATPPAVPTVEEEHTGSHSGRGGGIGSWPLSGSGALEPLHADSPPAPLEVVAEAASGAGDWRGDTERAAAMAAAPEPPMVATSDISELRLGSSGLGGHSAEPLPWMGLDSASLDSPPKQPQHGIAASLAAARAAAASPRKSIASSGGTAPSGPGGGGDPEQPPADEPFDARGAAAISTTPAPLQGMVVADVSSTAEIDFEERPFGRATTTPTGQVDVARAEAQPTASPAASPAASPPSASSSQPHRRRFDDMLASRPGLWNSTAVAGAFLADAEDDSEADDDDGGLPDLGMGSLRVGIGGSRTAGAAKTPPAAAARPPTPPPAPVADVSSITMPPSPSPQAAKPSSHQPSEAASHSRQQDDDDDDESDSGGEAAKAPPEQPEDESSSFATRMLPRRSGGLVRRAAALAGGGGGRSGGGKMMEAVRKGVAAAAERFHTGPAGHQGPGRSAGPSGTSGEEAPPASAAAPPATAPAAAAAGAAPAGRPNQRPSALNSFDVGDSGLRDSEISDSDSDDDVGLKAANDHSGEAASGAAARSPLRRPRANPLSRTLTGGGAGTSSLGRARGAGLSMEVSGLPGGLRLGSPPTRSTPTMRTGTGGGAGSSMATALGGAIDWSQAKDPRW